MINEASEKPAEADNSRLFFRNYSAPVLIDSQDNIRHSKRIKELAE
jgi:hypothetical protein